MSAITTERERAVVAVIGRLAKAHAELVHAYGELDSLCETSKAVKILGAADVIAAVKLMLLESIRE